MSACLHTSGDSGRSASWASAAWQCRRIWEERDGRHIHVVSEHQRRRLGLFYLPFSGLGYNTTLVIYNLFHR